MAIYDIDSGNLSNYKLSKLLSTPPVWQDNYHLIGQTTSGKALLFDYDGANQQLLGTSSLAHGAYFDSAYKAVFTELTTKTGIQLQSASLLIQN